MGANESRQGKNKNKRNSVASNTLSKRQNRTALSNLDGPPAPPAFVYNNNASTSRSSLQDSMSIFDESLHKTSINKLPKDTDHADELEAVLDKVNRNLKTKNFSISEASSSTKTTSSSDRKNDSINKSFSDTKLNEDKILQKKSDLLVDQKIKITKKNNVRIRRLSELNEQSEHGKTPESSPEDTVEPKPREKLNAKKEKLKDSISLSSAASPISAAAHKSFTRNSILEGKNSLLGRISISKKNATESSSDDPNETGEKLEDEKGGLYLETIDRLVDSNGEIIAKNETVKYLGKSASLNDKNRKNSLESSDVKSVSNKTLAKISSRKNSLDKKEIYIESKPVIKFESLAVENYAIRLQDSSKNVYELTKSELEEIAYVIKHHEKNSSTSGRYFYKDEEIYPDGPLKDYVNDPTNTSKKFEIEDLNDDELSIKAPTRPLATEQTVDNQVKESCCENDSLIKRIKIINVPKRTMHSNQHFIVDIDNDNVLASDLEQVDLDKLVDAIDKHRPLIRTTTSRYFLNAQEILPRGILRSYFSEYSIIEPPSPPPPTLPVSSSALKITKEVAPEPMSAIKNAPLDDNDADLPPVTRDYCVYLLEDGESKRSISELNSSEVERIALAIGKHWPETRTKNSKFFFHGVEIYPGNVSSKSKENVRFASDNTDLHAANGETNCESEIPNNMYLENERFESITLNESSQCKTLTTMKSPSLSMEKNKETVTASERKSSLKNTSFKPIEPHMPHQPSKIVQIKIIENDSGKESIKCVQVDQPCLTKINELAKPIAFNQESAKIMANNIVKDLLIDYAMKVNLKRSLSNRQNIQQEPESCAVQKQQIQHTSYASLKNLAFKKTGSLILQDDDENWDPLSKEIQSRWVPIQNCKNQSHKPNRISWGDNIIF